jgi:hypothetical protein
MDDPCDDPDTQKINLSGSSYLKKAKKPELQLNWSHKN